LNGDVDPNIRNNKNITALCTAAENGFGGMVTVLLDAGADPNAFSQ